MRSKIHRYTGEEIDVTFDARRCIHVAECLKRLPTVFDKSKRLWVQPDNDSADNIAAAIHACPSGALHYKRKDGGEAEPVSDHNTIRLARNGPLILHGNFTIVNGAGEVIVEDTRATLCRCGASSNKPFCDNSHIAIGFRAPTTINEPPDISETAADGKLHIETTTTGPLHITGTFTVLNSRGEPIYHGTDESFCRCGASGNSPFCDNSHSRIGFSAE